MSVLLFVSVPHFIYPQIGSVCPWDNNKRATVVLTFDDWTPGQYPIAVAELQKRNMSGTFFLMKPTVSSWEEVNQAVALGNEMGNHTLSHPLLTQQTPEQFGNEIRGMKGLIDQNVTTQRTQTFAYPFGPFNDQVIDSLKNSGHIAARTVMSSSGNYTYNFATTENDYFKITTYGMDGNTTVQSFTDEINRTIQGGGLLTFMYHSIDNAAGTYHDNWYAKVLQDSLQKQLDVLVGLKESVWVTTLAQAVKYHREAQCAQIKEVSPYKRKQWVVALTDTLSDNSIYNQPLSINLKTNGVWFGEVTQAGKPVAIDSVSIHSILFRAVPDGGPIVLKSTKHKSNNQ